MSIGNGKTSSFTMGTPTLTAPTLNTPSPGHQSAGMAQGTSKKGHQRGMSANVLNKNFMNGLHNNGAFNLPPSASMGSLPPLPQSQSQSLIGATPGFQPGVPFSGSFNNGIPLSGSFGNGIPTSGSFNNGIPASGSFGNGIPGSASFSSAYATGPTSGNFQNGYQFEVQQAPLTAGNMIALSASMANMALPQSQSQASLGGSNALVPFAGGIQNGGFGNTSGALIPASASMPMVAQRSPQTYLVVVDPKMAGMRSDLMNVIFPPGTYKLEKSRLCSTQNFPFQQTALQHTTVALNNLRGVIKLSNIPFNVKRSEIIAFLGRNSKILNDADEPVHIIMERITTRTQDAYVEFVSGEHAMRAVNKVVENQAKGKAPKIGDRIIDVQLSSQGELMKALFEHANGVQWEGMDPVKKPHENPNHPWQNFKSFTTQEEMTMLVKFVEVPQRVSLP